MTGRIWHYSLFALLAAFSATLISCVAASKPPSTVFVPVSVHAMAGLTCKLYANGHKQAEGITLVTDDDGYARFYAIRVDAHHPYRKQLLACRDARGATSTYAVDLGADRTFLPHPIDLKQERAQDRPALQGDPMLPSQQELISRGYGLRPDPIHAPVGYARWLLAASQPARVLESKRVINPKAGPIVTPGSGWAGAVLTGAPRYVAVQAYMNVPTAIPGGDDSGGTQTVFWNGLGGFNTGSGLIQSGFFLTTDSVAASYNTFREYCCNDPNGITYDGAFSPNPGDVLFVQNWYCDEDGTVDLNGGFGCSFVHDLTNGALLNCTSQSTMCTAAKGLPLCSIDDTVPNCMTPGFSAEFIAEQTSDQHGTPAAFTDFTPTVAITGLATSNGNVGTVGRFFEYAGTDPTTFVLTDWTNASTVLDVKISSSGDTTCFTAYPRKAYPQGLPDQNSPVSNKCVAAPLPSSNSPLDIARREELVAVILYGIIQDAGGVAVVGGKLVRIPPRGPISETLASLPGGLSERVAPLLRDLPNTGAGINALAVQLTKAVVSYRDTNLSRSSQP
jgi:hypothetical protein